MVTVQASGLKEGLAERTHKNYDPGPFLHGLEQSNVRPHVAVKDGPIGGAPGTRYRKQNKDNIEARKRVRRRTRGVG